MLERENKFY